MSYCSNSVSGITASLAIASTIRWHLGCDNSGQGLVLLLTSRGTAGGPKVPSACSWLLRWRLVSFSPYSPGVWHTVCKYRHRLDELHKHWWIHIKWRKCKNFKLGCSSWSLSGWRPSYVKVMLLATIFAVSHIMINYILSYRIVVDFSQGSYIRYNWCMIFRWS